MQFTALDLVQLVLLLNACEHIWFDLFSLNLFTRSVTLLNSFSKKSVDLAGELDVSYTLWFGSFCAVVECKYQFLKTPINEESIISLLGTRKGEQDLVPIRFATFCYFLPFIYLNCWLYWGKFSFGFSLCFSSFWIYWIFISKSVVPLSLEEFKHFIFWFHVWEKWRERSLVIFLGKWEAEFTWYCFYHQCKRYFDAMQQCHRRHQQKKMFYLWPFFLTFTQNLIWFTMCYMKFAYMDSVQFDPFIVYCSLGVWRCYIIWSWLDAGVISWA